MKSLKKILGLLLAAVIVSAGFTGCEQKGKQPGTEEHPAGEHEHEHEQDHPAGEQEHPDN